MENGGDILKDLAGLLGNSAFDEFAIPCQRNLAGTKEEIAHSNSMGIRPYGLG